MMAVWPQHHPRAQGWGLNLHKDSVIHVYHPHHVSACQALCPPLLSALQGESESQMPAWS